MILHLYQIAPFQVNLNSSIRRKNLAQSAIQYRFSVRCEVKKKDLQTSSQTPIYQPTQWSRDFIKGLDTKFELNYKDEVNELVEKVNLMINDCENGGMSTLGLIELIDDIEMLGLGYRFTAHITRLLDKIASTSEDSMGLEEEDMLYAASLKFRLLRQHGYKVSQDFLKRFKANSSGLTGYPQKDVKTLLSLYEASYLGFEGETYLHEAKLFATEHLLKINGLENDVMDHINHALHVSLNRRIHRIETRWYIDAYSKRKDANQLLLVLAKLDFNEVQSVYKKDLQEVSNWWEDLGLTRRLTFARDRVMEHFLAGVAGVYEPHLSSCRVAVAKASMLVTILDDVYDLYGSLDELEVLTSAVKRWDINAMKDMSETLQLPFLALYNTVNESSYATIMSIGENTIPALAKVWGEVLEAYFMEVKWRESNNLPTLEEYLNYAWRSVGQQAVVTHVYFCMKNESEKYAPKFTESFTNLIKLSSTTFRLSNDLTISSNEITRGEDIVNAISCYMHETGVSEEVAREYIKTLRDKTWMKLIEAKECADPFSKFPINSAQFGYYLYQYGDGLVTPDATAKDNLLSAIIEPFKFP